MAVRRWWAENTVSLGSAWVAWYCLVLPGIAWYCLVLPGMAWDGLYGLVWHSMAWDGLGWPGMAWWKCKLWWEACQVLDMVCCYHPGFIYAERYNLVQFDKHWWYSLTHCAGTVWWDGCQRAAWCQPGLRLGLTHSQTSTMLTLTLTIFSTCKKLLYITKIIFGQWICFGVV